MSDDWEEILTVESALSRRELYGAAQMVCRLARERDAARAALAWLQDEYSKKVTFYEQTKARNGLTDDWGQCSMICAKETLREIKQAQIDFHPDKPAPYLRGL